MKFSYKLAILLLSITCILAKHRIPTSPAQQACVSEQYKKIAEASMNGHTIKKITAKKILAECADPKFNAKFNKATPHSVLGSHTNVHLPISLAKKSTHVIGNHIMSHTPPHKTGNLTNSLLHTKPTSRWKVPPKPTLPKLPANLKADLEKHHLLRPVKKATNNSLLYRNKKYTIPIAPKFNHTLTAPHHVVHNHLLSSKTALPKLTTIPKAPKFSNKKPIPSVHNVLALNKKSPIPSVHNALPLNKKSPFPSVHNVHALNLKKRSAIPSVHTGKPTAPVTPLKLTPEEQKLISCVESVIFNVINEHHSNNPKIDQITRIANQKREARECAKTAVLAKRNYIERGDTEKAKAAKSVSNKLKKVLKNCEVKKQMNTKRCKKALARAQAVVNKLF